MQAKYTRLFAGEGGDSFLEDTTAELQPTFTLPGVPAAIFSAPFSASEGCFWLGVPKTGMEDTLHTAPRRMVFVTTQGEYQVTTTRGVSRKFPVGSVLVVEDSQRRRSFDQNNRHGRPDHFCRQLTGGLAMPDAATLSMPIDSPRSCHLDTQLRKPCDYRC